MRRRFILDGGALVEVQRAPARPRYYIGTDTTEPFFSHADGAHYSSKSRYRAECRARGFEEVACSTESRLQAVRDELANPRLPELSVAELNHYAEQLGIG